MSVLKEKIQDLYIYSKETLKSDKELSNSKVEELHFVNAMAKQMLKKIDKNCDVDFLEENGYYWLEHKGEKMVGVYIGNGVFRTIYGGLLSKNKCKVVSEVILKDTIFNE